MNKFKDVRSFKMKAKSITFKQKISLLKHFQERYSGYRYCGTLNEKKCIMKEYCTRVFFFAYFISIPCCTKS